MAAESSGRRDPALSIHGPLAFPLSALTANPFVNDSVGGIVRVALLRRTDYRAVTAPRPLQFS